MQVLSLLRKSKVSWPVALTNLLKMFHWFNFDIDTVKQKLNRYSWHINYAITESRDALYTER